ncbi:TetR family transcriptional regulator [Pseudonocardia hierapolitana]|uniref:TetR family transcriptional regulator n=1 Tax=Pseudonocardia hierapolitana TaxID=1128676 RepID=A0A561T0Y5_9PSEU|nr:helix-turn-helix domain-containing protein [Pseudonocardia hierapolitana]TWF80761.1 TetR family transcriptional regulator [Pseudonocardia hierapolitana]
MDTTNHRTRLVVGAADMLRRRGLHATSIREVARHSGAPLGSTYHYFPGGKDQLVTEAVRFAGDTVTRVLRERLAAGPVEGLRSFLALWRDVVISTDHRAGCPVLAVAVQESDAPAVEAAADVFRTWEALLATSLQENGVAATRARRLAALVVAAVEGAVAVCRADRSTRALDDVAVELDALLSAATAGRDG